MGAGGGDVMGRAGLHGRGPHRETSVIGQNLHVAGEGIVQNTRTTGGCRPGCGLRPGQCALVVVGHEVVVMGAAGPGLSGWVVLNRACPVFCVSGVYR